MSNTLGKIFRITTWGESHGEGVGVVIDGCPAGIQLSISDIETELDRRRPGQSQITTQRRETDKPLILSGVFEGVTLGTPIMIMVYYYVISIALRNVLKHNKRTCLHVYFVFIQILKNPIIKIILFNIIYLMF